VLALEIVNDRGAVFGFLPAMAFTVVMVTNLFIVWGAVRAARTGGPQVSVALPLEDAKVMAMPEESAKAVGSGEA
ncbi:MAG: hypothetical protein WBW69_15425, partial [Candidatus Korobacteraceae bacterium]